MTSERQLEGVVLVIFIRRDENGDILLDFRKGDRMLPKRSTVVATAELKPNQSEYHIQWIPTEGWQPCGHAASQGWKPCRCGLYRLVDSDLDRAIFEHELYPAVRNLVARQLFNERAELGLDDSCQFCDQLSCQGSCEEGYGSEPHPYDGVPGVDDDPVAGPFARQ